MSQKQLGWIVPAVQVVSAITQAGMSVYSATEMLDMAEEQAELNEEITKRKMALEEELVQAQIRIADIQSQGLETRTKIDLELAEFEAESIKANIKRLEEMALLQQQLDKIQLQREIDKQALLASLEKQGQNGSQTQGNQTQENQEQSQAKNTSGFGMLFLFLAAGGSALLIRKITKKKEPLAIATETQQ